MAVRKSAVNKAAGERVGTALEREQVKRMYEEEAPEDRKVADEAGEDIKDMNLKEGSLVTEINPGDGRLIEGSPEPSEPEE